MQQTFTEFYLSLMIMFLPCFVGLSVRSTAEKILLIHEVFGGDNPSDESVDYILVGDLRPDPGIC